MYDSQDDSESSAKCKVLKGRPLWLRIINPFLCRNPKRLFEFCDLWIIPPFIRNRCHAMLTAAWVHEFPYVQKCCPAELAASIVLRTLNEIRDDEKRKISVVDFCSGAGGPIPTIENLVNKKRSDLGQAPIQFLLTDIRPHLEAWMKVCAKSENLSFIPQKVDATDPPMAVISETSNANDTAAPFSSDSRIFRLYCLSFHHFTDDQAREVMRSTMETADGCAIIELQDRYLSSLLLILAFFPLQFITTLFWFWDDPLQWIFTYVIPVIPIIVTFDGLVSCLRTRSFEEIMQLVGNDSGSGVISIEIDGEGREMKTVESEGWVFKGTSVTHTWPLGNMNCMIGFKAVS